MISTYAKNKISHLESYPLGAQQISAALGEVPQQEFLKLWFRRWSTMKRWDKAHPEMKDRQTVLSCSYMRRLRSIHTPRAWRSEENSSPLEWFFFVYSVPRELRHKIGEMLLADALPQIRVWLVAHEKPFQALTSEHIGFDYDFGKEELIKQVESR